MGGGPVGLGHIFAAPWVRVHALRNARGRPLMSNPATMNAAVPVQPRNYEYVPVNYEYVPAGLEVGLVCRR